MHFLAFTLHLPGDIVTAKEYFLKATEVEGKPLDALAAYYEADHLFMLGDIDKAIQRTKDNLFVCENNKWPKDKNQCYYMLGMLSLPGSVVKAREWLQKLLQWTEKWGAMECIICSRMLAAEISYCSKDYDGALFEAVTGFSQSESCGFGKFAIDLLLQLSKIQLAIPDYKAALGFAREALDRSAHRECSYAWGEANGPSMWGLS